jgi:polar amino acid transport system ATP-binding protein
MIFVADGTILERGPPDQLISAPKHEMVKQFFKRMNELYRREGE